jgi:putative transposase
MFQQDMAPARIARLLRVTPKSVYEWRRSWRDGDDGALASKGQGGYVCKLDDQQLTQLRAALELGPAAYGWTDDQRWTLARIAAPMRRAFHEQYTLRGTSYLLHRIGFSWQVPAHRVVERDEDAVAAWRSQTWQKARG